MSYVDRHENDLVSMGEIAANLESPERVIDAVISRDERAHIRRVIAVVLIRRVVRVITVVVRIRRAIARASDFFLDYTTLIQYIHFHNNLIVKESNR